MTDAPTPKRISNRLTVSVARYGWPYWTNLEFGEHNVGLSREEAHDLLYAMTRICEYLDARERERERGT